MRIFYTPEAVGIESLLELHCVYRKYTQKCVSKAILKFIHFKKKRSLFIIKAIVADCNSRTLLVLVLICEPYT